ncbi:MAG: hypothetical protein PF904_10025 [Kiritimatiellae bacterium]|jgi:hypothetical protein|nr:hypothetical protein [Kiritimatiellia bacterium]
MFLNYFSVSFTTAFTNQPVVINQLQSYDYTNDLFSTRMDGAGLYVNGPVTTTGFTVALEDYEYDQDNRYDAYRPETIGWIAIEKGSGLWSGYEFEASVTADSLSIIDVSFNFINTYATAPSFIGCVATYSGADPVNMRLVSIDGSSFTIRGLEDTTLDDETSHNNEEVTYLAIDGTGDLFAYPHNIVRGAFTFDTNGEFMPYSGKEDVIFSYTLTDLYGNTDTRTVTIHVIAPFSGTVILVR